VGRGVMSFIAGSPALVPDPVIEHIRLLALDAAASDFFGAAVALDGDGDTMAVGATGDDDAASAAGAVYILVRSAGNVWSQQTKIIAPVATASLGFGATVSLSTDGNTLAIGNIGTVAGNVWVYTRSGTVWTLQQTLTGSSGAIGRHGMAVAVTEDGNTLVFGAPSQTNTFGTDGVVYVFTRTAGVWTQRARFGHSGGTTSDFCGETVAISSTPQSSLLRVVAGVAGKSYCVVHTFHTGTFAVAQEQTLTGPAAPQDHPGIAINADGSLVAFQVSATGARVYSRNGASWSLIYTLTSGSSRVAMDSDGEYIIEGGNDNATVAPLFRRNGQTWPLIKDLPGTGVAFGDRFNRCAISKDGSTVAVGSPNNDEPVIGTDAGCVFIFAASNLVS
jgi:hypothetical protein